MIHRERAQKIYNLISKEVVPALGCTEPIALALAVAKAREVLGGMPEKVNIAVSLNIYKNGMGVGIPGTSAVGLPMAAALGLIVGQADKNLEVLCGVLPIHEAQANLLLEQGNITIHTVEHPDKLYIEVECIAQDKKAKTIIQSSHSNFVYIALNDQIIQDSRDNQSMTQNAEDEEATGLSIDEIFDFATSEAFEDIRFILDRAQVNKTLSSHGLSNKSGMGVGANLMSWIEKNTLANDFSNYAMALTAAASDARMSGALLPAMSNSGSGNQGITAMVPVLATAEKLNASDETLARALILSNLTAIHIKKNFGRLSAACGCVVASTGASCGVCYLLGGDKTQIEHSIKNMIGNLSGMVCDGAKLGCALKVASGTSAAIQSAILGISNIYVPGNNGIISDDIETTIKNLGMIANEAMDKADQVILNIMTTSSK